MNDVPGFQDFLALNRQNVKLEGFNFDVNTFENLIAWWTPINEIPVILGVRSDQLDYFCNKIYHMNYKETYYKLHNIEMALTRRAIDGLSKQGNSTALNILSKHFMELEDNNQQDVHITIVNDLKSDEDDTQ